MQIHFPLAGITFRPESEIGQLRPKGECQLKKEPTNKFDPNAIQIIWDGHFLGFVPGKKSKYPEVQEQVLKVMDSGVPFKVEAAEYSYATGKGKTKSFNDNHEGVLGSVKFVLTADVKEEAAPAESRRVVDGDDGKLIMLRSFNEPDVEVEFYPDTHTYMYKGKQLKSVTRVVAGMYDKFDAKVIAPRCENKYGMKASDIERMWDLGGNAAAGFGTAMHLYMEMYETYGERGLPKHEFLKQIVLAFPWSPEFKAHSEVLITSVKRGMCGMSDRVLELPGRLLVCDYKFTPGSEEIKKEMINKLLPDLPRNKIGKNTVQLSLYAEMLEESNMTVSDDIVIHTWDQTWTHHRKPRIKGILDRVTA